MSLAQLALQSLYFVKKFNFVNMKLFCFLMDSLAVAGRVLWIRVSFSLSIIPSRSFRGIDSLVLFETQHGVRGPLCMTESDFLEKFFLPQKWGKWAKNSVFLSLLENLVINFFWIWSMKKFYNISCILTQMPNSLIRKIILILKFMMSQPGLQRITIHILLNMSQINWGINWV